LETGWEGDQFKEGTAGLKKEKKGEIRQVDELSRRPAQVLAEDVLRVLRRCWRNRILSFTAHGDRHSPLSSVFLEGPLDPPGLKPQ